MDSLQDPREKCIFFWSKDKRCKNGRKCRFWHDENYQTEWLTRVEHKQKKAKKESEAGRAAGLATSVQNFSIADASESDLLMDPSRALRALFRKRNWSLEVTGTSWSQGTIWRQVSLAGWENPHGMCHELVRLANTCNKSNIFWESPLSERVEIRCDWHKTVPLQLYHGTTKEGFCGIMASKRIHMTSDPCAVYASDSPEDVLASGYDGGFIMILEVVAIKASYKTSLALDKNIIPGITWEMSRKAKSEWVLHNRSFRVVGFLADVNLLYHFVRDELAEPSQASKSGFITVRKGSQTAWEVEDLLDEIGQDYKLTADGNEIVITASSSSAKAQVAQPGKCFFFTVTDFVFFLGYGGLHF